MDMIRSLNTALRFILEVCALASLGYWGIQTGKVGYIKAILGIGAPLLAGIIWGTFGSPGASISVKGLVRLALEIVIFGLASAGLVAAGRTYLGMILAILFVINRILMELWHQ
jgi:hypothetical protein